MLQDPPDWDIDLTGGLDDDGTIDTDPCHERGLPSSSESGDATPFLAAMDSTSPTKSVICQRCPPVSKFCEHREGCINDGNYFSYVTCERCQAMVVTRQRMRHHSTRCNVDERRLRTKKRRDLYGLRDRIITTTNPVHIITCQYCDNWGHADPNMIDIHEVFCAAVNGRGPARPLPWHNRFYPQGTDKFIIPLDIAVEINYVMHCHHTLRTQPRFKRLLQLAERDSLASSPGTVVTRGLPHTPRTPAVKRDKSPSPTTGDTRQVRAVSYKRTIEVHSEAWSGRSRGFMRGNAGYGTAAKDARRPADFGLGQLSHTAMRERNVKTVQCQGTRYVSITEPPNKRIRADAGGDGHSPSPPAAPTEVKKARLEHDDGGRRPPPAATVTSGEEQLRRRTVKIKEEIAETATREATTPTVTSPIPLWLRQRDSEERRDRLKIMLPNNLWVDAYGRSTSPHRQHRALMKRPSPTMTGHLVSLREWAEPALVAVDGELPTGWGSIAAEEHRFIGYKTTPGDMEPIPPTAASLPYQVPLFLCALPDGSRPPAGVLHTDCNFSRYDSVSYKAAGVNTRIAVKI